MNQRGKTDPHREIDNICLVHVCGFSVNICENGHGFFLFGKNNSLSLRNDGGMMVICPFFYQFSKSDELISMRINGTFYTYRQFASRQF